MRPIDLNADVGEGAGEDEALLAWTTSASVACGLHAGDAATMRRTCERAVARGVRIGAHIGYADREGFGRRELDVAPERLRDEAAEQVAALRECAAVAGGRVVYVKPHGALYHRLDADPAAAAAVMAGIRDAGGVLAVVGAPGRGSLRAAAEAGLPVAAEGFADRAYAPGGGLLPRSAPGAVLGPDAALAQAVALATDRSDLRTLCVHGDTAGAAALARAVRRGLEAAGVPVAPFA